MAEGPGLVTGPSPRTDGRHRATVVGLADIRLVAAGQLVAPAFLDDEPEIDAAASSDVLHRLAGPRPPVGCAVEIQVLGHSDIGALRKFAPDPPDDRSLTRLNDQLPGTDQLSVLVAQAAIAVGVVAAVPTVLERGRCIPVMRSE